MAEAWTEILEGEIPPNYLDAAYIRALRDKGTSFALSASDVVQGYRDVCASERAAPQIPQSVRLLGGDVCGKCHGSGIEQYTEDGYNRSRRCDHAE